MLSIEERSGEQLTTFRLLTQAINSGLRVAMPCTITYFDPVEQIVNVQPCITENVKNDDGTITITQLPQLLDLPIVIPQGGGYAITIPILAGDECLVVFGDMCIDAWWSNGLVQNQIESRRHDLSDGFAIIGVCSQPNRLENYSSNSLQIRNQEGTSYIDICGDVIDIRASSVRVNGVPIRAGV